MQIYHIISISHQSSGFNPTHTAAHTAATQAQIRCQSSPGTIDHSINIRFIFRFSISIFIIFISIISIVGLKPDAIDPIIDHHRSWRHTAGIIGNVGFLLTPSVTSGFAGTLVTSGFNPTHTATHTTTMRPQTHIATQAQMQPQHQPQHQHHR